MAEIDIPLQADIGGIASNAFGEHYLFAINRNLFQGTDASTVFRSHFGEAIFKEDTLHLIAGTDSGLFYEYVKTQGVPKGSRYLFVELPQVLALLEDMDDPQDELVVVSSENWLARAEEMDIRKYALLNRLSVFRSFGVVHGHYSDYPPFWRQFKADYDAFLKNLRIALMNRPFIIAQIENLTENQVPVICLKDSFKGKTAVVLAGGPSLDELLPWVRQHRQNLLVIAVSRISRSLIEAGIQPDISVSVDPQATNLNVCREMLEFQDGTLLVNNYHLSSNLLASWGGKKVFIGPRYPWSTSLQPENLQSSGGTTVTNSAFDLAVKTGVTQIILGGVDFCFGQQGHTHASGTAEHAMGSMPGRFERQVETNSGMMADCANGYQEAGENIDLQAKDAAAQGCRIINPAPWSMRLHNVEHLPLDDIQTEPLEQAAREVIEDKVPLTDKDTRALLYKEELDEIDRVLKELGIIKEQSNKALNYNSKLLSKGGGGNKPRNTSEKIDHVKAKKVDRIDEQLHAKYASTIELIKRYDVSQFVPLLGHDIKKMEELVENSQVYFKAMAECSSELINILRKARARILSRLEEEASQPSVQNLLDQWMLDQQPGRAIVWAEKHKTYVSQLPDAQQDALREFQDSFNDSVEKLGEDYTRQVEKQGLELDGIAGRAKEYFLCQDKDGLIRLLTSMETHHDQKQAAYFTPLLQGYIAELEGEPALAIDAYQMVTKGSIHIDVLMRLFALHTKVEDFDSTVEDLKILSGISSTFTPMYADMLQATNNIDSAVEVYTNYLLENPDDLNTMMSLGKLFKECGSAEGVEWTMGYILGKDPDNHTAQQILNEMKARVEMESTQA